jgi:hypothetical protein
MPEIKLPNSKLKVRIGVMNVVPHYKTTVLGLFIQIMKSHHFKIKLKVKIQKFMDH